MRVFKSDLYVPVGKEDVDREDSLIIHSPITSSGITIIIFIHGLGGRRYETWGLLPRFIFEDFADVDVGLYDYASGARRLLRGSSILLSVHARELADTIRESNYKNVILIGHSMGGLLCKAVIKDLIDTRTRARDNTFAVEKIAGLFLFATPQAGSLRVPKFIAPITKDGRVLRAHSSFVTEIDERFKDRVETRVKYRGTEKERVAIPTYAVLGTGDTWVDRLSASLGLPRDHTLTVRGTHSSIVKAKSREGGIYYWLAGRVRECITVPSVLTPAADLAALAYSTEPESPTRVDFVERLRSEVKRVVVEMLEPAGDPLREHEAVRDVLIEDQQATLLGPRKIVLCHAPQDARLAGRLWDLLMQDLDCDQLRFVVWRADRDVLAGDDAEQRFRAAVADGEMAIVALSSSWLGQPELGEVVQGQVASTGLLVVPVVLRALNPHAVVPGFGATIYPQDPHSKPFAELRGVPARDNWVSGLVDHVHQVLLSNATATAVQGDVLTPTLPTASLARRLAEERNAEIIKEALRSVLGVDWQVRCEHAGANPAPKGATPPETGERPSTGARQSPDPEPSDEGLPAELPAPGHLDAAAVRRVWPTLLDAVRERSRAAQVLLSNATASAVQGDVLTLTLPTASLARRLAEERNAEIIKEALRSVLGVDWQVRCEHAGADPAPQGATPPVL